MQIWQPFMISLARNQRLKQTIQSFKPCSRMAERFIGGKDIHEAMAKETTAATKQKGIAASLFYLGEYLEDRELIASTLKHVEEGIKKLAEKKRDIHISIDPTQVGWQIDEAWCRNNIIKLARMVTSYAKPDNKRSTNCLMLDMEDSAVTEFTFSLYKELTEADLLAAITLQAYLYRTRKDVEEVVTSGGIVRLVKGAFAEGSTIAYTRKKDVDQSFLSLSHHLLSLESRHNGCYPIFATHDDKLIGNIIDKASQNGWSKSGYEFEMLFGVRTDLQQTLVSQGETVRVYMPYGSDWWPYVARRIGENIRNVKFLFNILKPF